MKWSNKLYSQYHLTFVFSILFTLLSVNPGMGQTDEEQVGGRYKFSGKKISHRITIPSNPPAAVILVQYLPIGTAITEATPPYASYDPEQGIAKWLFTKVYPGFLKVRLTLGQEVARDKISAEVLFKDDAGGSETLTITPMPLKRATIEGC